jgi:hypothetical protein
MMPLGDLLIAANLANREQIDAALARQERQPARLADILVEMGAANRAAIDAFMANLPPEPVNLQESGISDVVLIDLLIKLVYVGRLESISQMTDAIKLPRPLVVELINQCVQRHLLQAAGSGGQSGLVDMRYYLTDTGQHFAKEALQRSQYSGAAPVPLGAFNQRVRRQRVTSEPVSWERIRSGLGSLTIADHMVEKLGPAVNSGRAILLYGPPGNGKTSIALSFAGVFSDVIFVPFAVEIEGQIMRIYDPNFHRLPVDPDLLAHGGVTPFRHEGFDARWVPIRRPFIVTGGELTLSMLDLSYDPTANFYEAPLHLKALGGCFIIDDFGRQIVSPAALLNRWIVPLESRVDYLKLHTGTSFQVPFEEMVVFSTNLDPEDLMDPAFLRRLPYKLEIGVPTPEAFREIFANVAAAASLEVPPGTVESVIEMITQTKKMELAAYHPRFIVDQVLATCRFMKQPPHFEPRFIAYAVDNLRVRRPEGEAGKPAAAKPYTAAVVR